MLSHRMWFATALSLLITSLPVCAQTDSCSRRAFSITLADQNWAPIRDLKTNDLVGEYQGKPVQIVSITPDPSPARIVILLDASGSFRDSTSPNKWTTACKLAGHLVETNSGKASFALIVFNERMVEELSFGDPKLVLEKLSAITSDGSYLKNVRGKTALWDAIASGIAMFGRPTSADAIYAITDGRENASRTHYRELRRRLAAARVRVFVSLILGGYRSRTPEQVTEPAEMADLVEPTGGAVFGPILLSDRGPATAFTGVEDKQLTLPDALANFYQNMLSGERIEVALPSEPEKWSDWKLALSKQYKKSQNTRLSYPRNLAPCSELTN